MNNVYVKNIPSIEEIKYKARSISDSHQLNTIQEQVFNDILDLFNKANVLQKEFYELNLAANIESSCYSQRLQEANIKIAQLQEQYNNLLLDSDDFRIVTQYAMNAIVDDMNLFAANVDKETNDIIANIASSTSKTRLYDETYDETLVPPSLKIYVGPDTFVADGEHILSIEDSDISNALDGNVNSTWLRKVVTDTSVDFIENEIVLGLPEDIITSRLVNQIIIYPYPSGYIDILDVQYKSNGAWETVSGFKNHVGYTTEEYEDIFGNKLIRGVIADAPNLRFNFKSVQTNQVKIKFRQRHYTYDATNNRRIWYIGLRDINVNYNRYTKEHSEFDMIYEFPDTEKHIKVYDTLVCCNNENDTNVLNNIYKEYFYYDDEGNTHKISDTLPFVLEGKKMMVRFTIEGVSETPNIAKCSVQYKLV